MPCNFENLVRKLMKSLPQPCVNSKFGCKEIIMAEDMLNHEPICDFQKVYCVMLKTVKMKASVIQNI